MLPTDTKGKVGGGEYFKPEKGNNKILIVGDVVTGYEYWTNDNKVYRSPEMFEETPNIRVQEKVNPQTGEKEQKTDSQKFFWALPVYVYDTDSIMLYEITQKGIRDDLLALQEGEWGNPVGSYTITIKKEGEGFQTKYTVTPNMTKDGDETIKKAMEMYKKNPIDIEAMMFGDNS